MSSSLQTKEGPVEAPVSGIHKISRVTSIPATKEQQEQQGQQAGIAKQVSPWG